MLGANIPLTADSIIKESKSADWPTELSLVVACKLLIKCQVPVSTYVFRYDHLYAEHISTCCWSLSFLPHIGQAVVSSLCRFDRSESAHVRGVHQSSRVIPAATSPKFIFGRRHEVQNLTYVLQRT